MDERSLRAGGFFGVFAVMAAWEAALPRRISAVPRAERWLGNLSLTLFNTAAVHVLLPVSAVGTAAWAQEAGWGVLAGLPGWAVWALSLLALDLAVYLQHWACHGVPLLWRLHKVHHADQDIDVTTGLRFHPVEILLSMLYKCAVVAVLGAPPGAVVVFEVVLNATALFNHANARIPLAFDGLLRLVVVTPDMHRVHHSVVPAETNSNYGFNLPWWDRLFGTYRAQPAAGHAGVVIGLPAYREAGPAGLGWMLALPWRG
ncbi:MAG: sterol desaturase family protein [Elusimicrobia bacterium]|nr:sterol desaturase family protein [Elusimicrobiota bacterium]